ncbi:MULTISPECIES: hypothetical protein [Haloferacaceae]|uniref:DUF8060 domain-containing protein n=1 Tax=Halorubrum glutamatedens TaxID=2707018 RepID=A0ABD5QP13_9EURY|nr:hypothetical protein [Halobellus captivus]
MSDDPAERPADAETDRDRTTDPLNTDAMTDTLDETETASTTTVQTTASRIDPAPATDGGTASDDRTREDDPETSEEGGSRLSRLSSNDLRGLLDRIGLAALVLLALIAGWSFYSQTGRAIRTWLDPAYQPIALAAFNLAVLFVALAGVAHQLYRIRVGDGERVEPRDDPEPSREGDLEPSRAEESRTSEDR